MREEERKIRKYGIIAGVLQHRELNQQSSAAQRNSPLLDKWFDTQEPIFATPNLSEALSPPYNSWKQ